MMRTFIVAFLTAAIIALIKINKGTQQLVADVQSIHPDEPDQSSDYVSGVYSAYNIDDSNMRLSDKGIELLKSPKIEGFSAKAYPDHKGYSIGYGHLIRPGDGLTRDSVITKSKADALLRDDVSSAENAVIEAIDVPLTQNQFDALVIFCYNVGVSAFMHSTLARKINAEDPTASNEFDRWIYASGEVNDVLVARRNMEQNLFLS
jgi:GH24 family phage-related lysozyme (muramidase)